ncbi:hypothetical protein QZM92_22710 [Burkholderia multivorans]|uniref:hypothetical protein n=1 Tax=Burkholderia multivorans TaxID=87883 RepID=UPI001C25FF99|nr:hypothetical protein [Burkholderia multivorans]MBU9574277.1 hypothetical protein [Burkholderia multivorans]MDN7964810.1 hypothetical protein [Burkholderia multivorans]
MTIALHKVDDRLPEDLSLAIVICGEAVTHTEGQRHVGFVVKGDGDTLHLFDLAWHNTCRYKQIDPGYAYVISDFLDPFTASALIGLLVTLQSINSTRLPYSIVYDGGEYFDRDTKQLIKTELGAGRTCATFVLAVLEHYGIDLLDLASWPITEEDAGWQAKILTTLKASRPTSTDEFLAQFDHIGKVPRFRPEEVVGAAYYFEDEPLPHSVVQPAGLETIAELRRLGLGA